MQLPLAQFSKAFKLQETKGYFPHFFNKRANAGYDGPIPDQSYYGCESMSPKDRGEFLKWHDELVRNNYRFKMSDEILRYCLQDVNILRTGCLKFRECFLETNNVDPFLECLTIASACNLVFRKNFLKAETIGIIPNNGYRLSDQHSTQSIEWLTWVTSSTGKNITNACKLYNKHEDGETILYYDVCSLYPYVNKYCKYPIGHPKKIYVGPEECSTVDVGTVDGLIKCCVRPPQNLYHPVLPYRCNGKLTFPLCKKCVALSLGTFVADELRKAVECSYKVVEIFEVWEYKTIQYNKDTDTDGLFTQYVNNFLKLKQDCGGWPQWCKSDEDKKRYIAQYKERENIELDESNISPNSGLRLLAKFMLNSFWGKIRKKKNAHKTDIIHEPLELFKLITNHSVDVHSLTVINSNVLLATWKRRQEDVIPLKTVNVAIAAYTTAAARLVCITT